MRFCDDNGTFRCRKGEGWQLCDRNGTFRCRTCATWQILAGCQFLFVAGFLLFLHVMIGLIKNTFRRRALKGVKPFDGVRQIFPQIGNLTRVGVLCKVENLADVQAFEELLLSFSGDGATDNGMACMCRFDVAFNLTNVELHGVVLEGNKCFKDKASKVDFQEFCTNHGILFVPKECRDWKGIPESAGLFEFYKKNTDLLISLDTSQDFTLEYIAYRSSSRFVSGVHQSKLVPYSLILEPGDSSITFKEYVEKLFGYLAMMQG